MKRALTPLRLAGLTLRNRVIKTATFEGMSRGGIPSPALTEHHAALARGGVGMTTLAYVAVSPHGRTFEDQLVMREDIVPHLRELTDAVHEAGAAVSIQLAHCGGFSKDLEHRHHRPKGPLGPSRSINLYGALQGLVWTKPMREVDIEAVPQQFALAATRAREAGFDAIELHLGHGYLLSQFLSPAINRRRDHFGGSLENRLRLPLAVVRAVRAAVGPQVPILCKTNLRDDIPGGLELPEAIEIAKALEREGVDALVLSGGFVSRSPFYLLRGARPLREMIAVERKPMQRVALRVFGPKLIAEHPFEPLYFLPLAREVRRAVEMPLCLLGGVVSGENLATAMDEGFELVAMGRALLENPNFVRELESGLVERSACTHCNVCIAEMDRDGVRCVLPVRIPRMRLGLSIFSIGLALASLSCSLPSASVAPSEPTPTTDEPTPAPSGPRYARITGDLVLHADPNPAAQRLVLAPGPGTENERIVEVLETREGWQRVRTMLPREVMAMGFDAGMGVAVLHLQGWVEAGVAIEFEAGSTSTNPLPPVSEAKTDPLASAPMLMGVLAGTVLRWPDGRVAGEASEDHFFHVPATSREGRTEEGTLMLWCHERRSAPGLGVVEGWLCSADSDASEGSSVDERVAVALDQPIPRPEPSGARIEGSGDQDVIRRIVHAHIREVRGCYNVGLLKDPTLAGRVTIYFVIESDGRIGDVLVKEDALTDPGVGLCIANAIKSWRFPKPAGGGNVKVTYPFNLQPG